MSVEEKAVNLAQPTIQLIQESGKWRYEEQLLNHNRIAIIGGGHCSLELSRVMSQLDYEVLVFDTRQEVSTLTQNTYARSVKIVEDYQADLYFSRETINKGLDRCCFCGNCRLTFWVNRTLLSVAFLF